MAIKEDKGLIYQLIPKIMGEIAPITKSRKNQQQNYSFRGIDDVYNELNEHMSENGVFCTNDIIDAFREERTTAKGGLLIYTILTVRFTFFAPDGSFVLTTTRGEAMDSGDKSSPKAMSIAYKYALVQIFCIPTEDDKDAENQTHQPLPKKIENTIKPNPMTDEQYTTIVNLTTEIALGDIETRNKNLKALVMRYGQKEDWSSELANTVIKQLRDSINKKKNVKTIELMTEDQYNAIEDYLIELVDYVGSSVDVQLAELEKTMGKKETWTSQQAAELNNQLSEKLQKEMSK